MRLATPFKASSAKTEQIILFRVSGQLFAVSSASVQEVRSADSMSGAATEISAPGLRKVRYVVRRGDRSIFIVNGAMHFGLRPASAPLLFVLQDAHSSLDRWHREDDNHDAPASASAFFLSRRARLVPRIDGTRSNRRSSSAPGRILVGGGTGLARCSPPARGEILWRRARGGRFRAMTVSTELNLQSFVMLRLGERRFAVSASQIAELVAPSRIFRFPHRTPKMEGVILRRGRIVPVCDVSETLLGKRLSSRRFYLITARQYGTQREWVAMPVSGECELIHAEMMAAGESDAPHVAGWLSHNGEVIEVLNLDTLTPGPKEMPSEVVAPSRPEARP